MIRFFARTRRNFVRELAIWLLALIVSVPAVYYLLPNEKALGLGTPDAIVIYSDNSTASTKYRTLTNSGTLGGETSDGLGLSTDADQEVLKTAFTRKEMAAGQLHDDGKIVIRTFNSTTWTTQRNYSGLVATANTNMRAFDLAYENLTGRLMWVFADDPTTGKLYYCLFDGSAWTPSTECAATPALGAGNEINLTDGTTALTGVPQKLKLVRGKGGSNDIWLLVEDANADLYVIKWNGTSWDTATDITASTTLSCNNTTVTLTGMCFTMGVEAVTRIPVLFYTEGTSLLRRTFDEGTNTWSSASTDATLGSAGNWLDSAEDDGSDRIALVTSDSGADFRPLVWKADGTTVGITTGNTDTAVEATNGRNSDVAWERRAGNATRFAVFTYTDNNALLPWRETATCDGTGCTFAALASIGTASTNCVDDCDRHQLIVNPHGNDMFLGVGDIDSDFSIYRWSGSAWSKIGNSLTTAGALVDGTANTNHIMFPYSLSFWRYASWSRNWRFYSGTDTASVPTTALASENTAPTLGTVTDSFRLRINYAERNNGSLTDSRKKLQYTSGCTPNSSGGELGCTWNDVDDVGGSGIWRYKDPTCSPTDCADGTLLTGSVLTGTNATCSAGNGCGTWVLDKDAATGLTSMDHNTGIIQESEWIIEGNSGNPPAGGTTYYFRVFNVTDDRTMYREQDASDCGAGSAACTYPSLVTPAPAGPTTEDVLRHGNWFSSGVEQSFFWAN